MLAAVAAAALCAARASAGQGGDINVLVVGDADSVSSAALGVEEEKEGAADIKPSLQPRPCVTTGW